MRLSFLLLALALTSPARGQEFVNARLVAEHSGKCLSVVGQSGADGASVIQRPCTGTPDQTIRLEAAADGEHFRLRPQHSNSCLDVAEGARGDGGAIVQWACWGEAANQLWRLDFVESTPTRKVGTFRSAHSGRCLSVVGASTDDGAGIGQWTCAPAGNIRWRMEVVR